MHGIIQVLALTTTAAALAVPQTFEKKADIRYESTFDNLATNIAVPQLYPVGLYNGLAWGGVVVLRPLKGISSVIPHSEPQHAGAAGPLDLLQLQELTLATFATLKTSTTVRSFDLDSFWWGFGTDTGTTAGLAQPGTLHVVAYHVTGRRLPTESFTFAPATPIQAPLVFAQLPATFKNLQNVTFAVANSEPTSERTYIAIDNVRHVNHS